MQNQAHWDHVYDSKADDQLSWYQPKPDTSLELILEASRGRRGVIDVGGGSSTLIDFLLQHPFDRLAVLDLSRSALARSQARLKDAASRVEWLTADVTTAGTVGRFDVWHDRAVFHFLTDPGDREAYVRLAGDAVPVGGHLVVATFAPGGPPRCSGLDVCRYDADLLSSQFAPGFGRIRSRTETHMTKSGVPQEFLYAVFRRVAYPDPAPPDASDTP